MMLRKMMEQLVGEFSTVREELIEEVEQFCEENEIDVFVEDLDECISVQFDNEYDEEDEMFVYIESAGRTFYISHIH